MATLQEAEFVLKVYDLRREAVLRESRAIITGKFSPKSYEEFIAITKPDHEYNAAFRQVSSYWEMIYSFAKSGAIDPDFLVSSGNGEGLYIYARFAPFIEQLRVDHSPLAFANCEWLVKNSEFASLRYNMMLKRLHPTMNQ